MKSLNSTEICRKCRGQRNITGLCVDTVPRKELGPGESWPPNMPTPYSLEPVNILNNLQNRVQMELSRLIS